MRMSREPPIVSPQQPSGKAAVMNMLLKKNVQPDRPTQDSAIPSTSQRFPLHVQAQVPLPPPPSHFQYSAPLYNALAQQPHPQHHQAQQRAPIYAQIVSPSQSIPSLAYAAPQNMHGMIQRYNASIAAQHLSDIAVTPTQPYPPPSSLAYSFHSAPLLPSRPHGVPPDNQHTEHTASQSYLSQQRSHGLPTNHAVTVASVSTPMPPRYTIDDSVPLSPSATMSGTQSGTEEDVSPTGKRKAGDIGSAGPAHKRTKEFVASSVEDQDLPIEIRSGSTTPRTPSEPASRHSTPAAYDASVESAASRGKKRAPVVAPAWFSHIRSEGDGLGDGDGVDEDVGSDIGSEKASDDYSSGLAVEEWQNVSDTALQPPISKDLERVKNEGRVRKANTKKGKKGSQQKDPNLMHASVTSTDTTKKAPRRPVSGASVVSAKTTSGTSGANRKRRKVDYKALSRGGASTPEPTAVTASASAANSSALSHSPLKKRSPTRPQNSSGNDEWTHDPRVVYCLCKTPASANDPRVFIQCDACDEWFHAECVCINESETDGVEKFVCLDCAELGRGETRWWNRCQRQGCNGWVKNEEDGQAEVSTGADDEGVDVSDMSKLRKREKYCSDSCGIQAAQTLLDTCGLPPLMQSHRGEELYASVLNEQTHLWREIQRAERIDREELMRVEDEKQAVKRRLKTWECVRKRVWSILEEWCERAEREIGVDAGENSGAELLASEKPVRTCGFDARLVDLSALADEGGDNGGTVVIHTRATPMHTHTDAPIITTTTIPAGDDSMVGICTQPLTSSNKSAPPSCPYHPRWQSVKWDEIQNEIHLAMEELEGVRQRRKLVLTSMKRRREAVLVSPGADSNV